MEDNLVASRLKSLISSLGLSDSQFADKSSISRPTLSLLLSGKNKKISDVMLTQIHEAFPEVSILWLLFGEGEMFKKETEETPTPKKEDENPIFQDNYKDNSKESNLVSLKQIENVIQNVINKSFEGSIIQLENVIQESSNKKSPRKVSKITVYYDDSTFESFIPEKSEKRV